MPLSPELQAKVDCLRRALEADAWPRTIQYVTYGGQIIEQPRARAEAALACLDLSNEQLAAHIRRIEGNG